MIPQGFIQDLLARADIVDVVGQVVPLKKAGINYKGLCPFHGEKTASFIVSPSRQTYHCFGCGAHGNAVGFLMEHSGLGFIEAIRELAGDLGVAVPEEDSTPEDRARAAQARERQLSLTELLGKANQHYRQQLKASPRAIDYLKRRGLSGEIAARFGLDYAPSNSHALASCFPQYDDPQLVDAGLVILRQDEGEDERRYDRFRDRIMFPIRNPKGEVIGFGARVIDQGEPKYLNSPETPVFVKGRELYGLYEGRVGIRQRGYVLVTEGYMDVVALAQWGFPNAVATLGTAFTADHVAKLLRFSEQVVFSFDGDAAGRRAAARALEAVLPHATDTRSFRFLFLPAEHDPDSFIREQGTAAFEACVSQALPLSRQLIAVGSDGCDLATPEGRARMLAQARPLMEQLPDGLLREQLLTELAREGGVSPQVLLGHWQGAARSGGRSPSGPQMTGQPGPADRSRPTPPTAHLQDAGSPAPPSWVDDMGGHPGDGWSPGDSAAADHWGEWGNGPGNAAPSRPGSPYRQGWSGSGSRSQGQGQAGPGFGPKGQGRTGSTWKGKGGGRWRDRDEAPWPRLPPPRTTTPLDRAAWLLVHDAQLWLHLPADIHELLARQPSPYGEFFTGIDRIVHDQGALPMSTLLTDLLADPGTEAAGPGLRLLIERLRGLHEFNENGDPAGELAGVLHQLRLQAVNDEITLLSESGDLSDEARQQHRRLLEELRTLKAGPATARE